MKNVAENALEIIEEKEYCELCCEDECEKACINCEKVKGRTHQELAEFYLYLKLLVIREVAKQRKGEERKKKQWIDAEYCKGCKYFNRAPKTDTIEFPFCMHPLFVEFKGKCLYREGTEE